MDTELQRYRDTELQRYRDTYLPLPSSPQSVYLRLSRERRLSNQVTIDRKGQREIQKQEGERKREMQRYRSTEIQRYRDIDI